MVTTTSPPTMSRIGVVWILIISTTMVFAVPVFVQKRQSDQRVAELETLLAMHKYGVGGSRRVGGRNSPAGYGLIDFNYIGRKKKSEDTDPRFLKAVSGSGNHENHLKQILSWPDDLSLAALRPRPGPGPAVTPEHRNHYQRGINPPLNSNP